MDVNSVFVLRTDQYLLDVRILGALRASCITISFLFLIRMSDFGPICLKSWIIDLRTTSYTLLERLLHILKVALLLLLRNHIVLCQNGGHIWARPDLVNA